MASHACHRSLSASFSVNAPLRTSTGRRRARTVQWVRELPCILPHLLCERACVSIEKSGGSDFAQHRDRDYQLQPWLFMVMGDVAASVSTTIGVSEISCEASTATSLKDDLEFFSPTLVQACPTPSTESPPLPPRPHQQPALLLAMKRDSVDVVQALLTEDPNIANEPFWECDVEPPLCAAVRLMCCPGIVELMLAFGADANEVDLRNRTPLCLLHAMVRAEMPASVLAKFKWKNIEELLFANGARGAALVDVPCGMNPLDLAVSPWNVVPSLDSQAPFALIEIDVIFHGADVSMM